MATYKGIRGHTIRTIVGDASPLIAGDIWYNSSSKKIKGAKLVAAWATGGTMNTARKEAGAAGTQTAYLAFGGQSPPATVDSEAYDGSSWTEGANLNVGRAGAGNCGATQTAALFFAGYTPSPAAKVATAEKWNGTSWTEVGDLNTARDSLAGAGTTTAGLAIGGATPGGTVVTVCEEYDGSSWAESGDLNTSASYRVGIGTQTAAFGCGGYISPAVQDIVEEYNGTSWTETTDFNTARRSGAAAGTTSNGLLIGGVPTMANTEAWDGLRRSRRSIIPHRFGADLPVCEGGR